MIQQTKLAQGATDKHISDLVSAVSELFSSPHVTTCNRPQTLRLPQVNVEGVNFDWKERSIKMVLKWCLRIIYHRKWKEGRRSK